MKNSAVQSERPAAREAQPIRLLLLEDVESDAALVLRALGAHGFDVTTTRVTSPAAFEAVLVTGLWDVCIADDALAGFDAALTLGALRRLRPDLPLVLVAGAVTEDRLRAGAHQCIGKQHLGRLLGPAVDRALATVDRRLLREASEAERARLVEEARASERRFQSLVSAMHEVVFSVDAELRYTGAYGNGAELGFSLGTVVGRRPHDVLESSVASLHETAYRKAFDGEPVVFDWSQGRVGAVRHYQTSVSPLRDDAGNVTSLVGVTREITRQKEMQEQLLLSERLATIGSMTAGLTHELNNPLTSLLLNLECLVAQSPQVPEPLADAWSAARRLLDIITDVKLIARAADARHGTVDVCRLLDSSARLAAPELRHRALLIKDYPPTSAHVQANESRLGQVFLNLIVNAAQAIPPGKADRNTVRLVVHTAPETVTVEFVDTGVGMSREVLTRLFTPFFTTKAAGVGSGIGLSISKRIIDSLDGRIEVESKGGQGTTFRVILPRVIPAGEASG